jgi:hypothetical protein
MAAAVQWPVLWQWLLQLMAARSQTLLPMAALWQMLWQRLLRLRVMAAQWPTLWQWLLRVMAAHAVGKGPYGDGHATRS